MEKLSQRFGGLRDIDVLNNVVRDVEDIVKIRPHRDIEMFIYWNRIEFHDGYSVNNKFV